MSGLPGSTLALEHDPRSHRLSALLLETGKAHHRAYIETDGYDPEWPLWYAAYLQPRLRQDFGLEVTQSELVYWILLAEKRRLAEAVQLPWPDVYARCWLASELFSTGPK